MPAPPMNDSITLFLQTIDPATGEVQRDKYGREIEATEATSEARVAYTTELIVDRNGQQVEAKLEIDLPTEQEVYSGVKVVWIDRFDKEVEAVIETVGEILSYSGKKVYWRKCFAT